MPDDRPYWQPSPYGSYDPADYCRALREQVRSGVYDSLTANAMWQNYRKSLKTLGLPDPGPCDLGGGDTRKLDAGYADAVPALGVPDAAYAAQDQIVQSLDPTTWIDPTSWFPLAMPEIPLPSSGGFDWGQGYEAPFPDSPGGLGMFDSQGYAPGAGPQPEAGMATYPPYATPPVELMARGPDGTYHAVPRWPRPPPPLPPAPPPSPYEGVPVTGSFSIKES